MKKFFTKQQIKFIMYLSAQQSSGNLSEYDVDHLWNDELEQELKYKEYKEINSLVFYKNKPVKIVSADSIVIHGMVINFLPSENNDLSEEGIVVGSIRYGIVTLYKKDIADIKVKDIYGRTILKNLKRRYPILLRLRELLNEQVELVDVEGRMWQGYISDYIAPEENACNQEIIIIHTNYGPIEFYEKNIFSATIIK